MGATAYRLMRGCAEPDCTDLDDCEICQTCSRHCMAAPNDGPSHRANLDMVLARFLERRAGPGARRA